MLTNNCNKIYLSSTLLLFLASFNYNLIRNLKDTLVLEHSGIELIPFIKIWFAIPVSTILLYVMLAGSKKYNSSTICYGLNIFFLFFFTIFTLFVYPNINYLTLNLEIPYLSNFNLLTGLIKTLKNWHISLFYSLSEAWGNFIFISISWNIVNSVYTYKEAKKHYSFFKTITNLTTILSSFLNIITGHLSIYFFSNDLNLSWKYCFSILMYIFIFTNVLLLLLYVYIYKLIPSLNVTYKFNKKKFFYYENIKSIFSSSILSYIAIMIICYNISSNLTEILWKAIIKKYYFNAILINNYINYVNTIMGIIATLISITSIKYLKFLKLINIIKLGPKLILYTSIPFIFLLSLTYLYYEYSSTFLFIVLLFGSFSIIVGKSIKYSILDISKEILYTYIPNNICKQNGKLIIDGTLPKISKLISSISNQFMITYMGSILNSAIIILFIVPSVLFFQIKMTKILPSYIKNEDFLK